MTEQPPPLSPAHAREPDPRIRFTVELGSGDTYAQILRLLGIDADPAVNTAPDDEATLKTKAAIRNMLRRLAKNMDAGTWSPHVAGPLFMQNVERQKLALLMEPNDVCLRRDDLECDGKPCALILSESEMIDRGGIRVAWDMGEDDELIDVIDDAATREYAVILPDRLA